MTTLSATEVVRRFSDLLNRIVYRQERFQITRGGTAVAELVPVANKRGTVADLLSVWGHEARDSQKHDADLLDDTFADDLAAVKRGQTKVPTSPWDT